jgi:cytochrome oxidase Cu insertion factor (SCO1/SenC/PrrC family)
MTHRDVRSTVALFALACAISTVPASPRAAVKAADVFAEMGVQPVAPPAPAPDLVLQAADGSAIRLADFRGKVVVLEFFVTT